jgi:hypothetical protein
MCQGYVCIYIYEYIYTYIYIYPSTTIHPVYSEYYTYQYTHTLTHARVYIYVHNIHIQYKIVSIHIVYTILPQRLGDVAPLRGRAAAAPRAARSSKSWVTW